MAIRKNNDPYARTTTNFRGQNSVDLITTKGLTVTNVNSFDEMKAQLDLKRPVIVLVYNHYYVREEQGRLVPYAYELGFSLKKSGANVPHIVIVTGYDNANIYINDPLATKLLEGGGFVVDSQGGTNFRIPIDSFKKATSEVAKDQNLGELFGMAVASK